MEESKINFPKRAIITVGKAGAKREIHIGHLAGGMIEADIYARFLKSQIGEENVLLFSGSECYGSSIIQSYEKHRDEFDTMEDYIYHMYSLQKSAIEKFQIDFSDYFCITDNKQLNSLHTLLCERFVDALKKEDLLIEQEEEVLIDPSTGRFLNYKQVEATTGDGQKDGLKYDTAGAHELISKISKEKPRVEKTKNYFVNLEKIREDLVALHKKQYGYISKYTAGYINDPLINIPNQYLEKAREAAKKYEANIVEGKKSSAISTNSVPKYKEIIKFLSENHVDFSTPGVLDQCRLTGSSEWGIKVNIDGQEKNLWVWIDSMLEPISFTIDYLNSKGKAKDEWQKWWCEEDAEVCHFMAQDNVFFYTMVENALLLSWNKAFNPKFNYPDFHFTPMRVLFNGKYDGPFPTADLLLQKYTPEQIRYSVASMGRKNSSFNPEKLLNDELEEDNITSRTNSFMGRIKRLAVNAANQLVNIHGEFDADEKAVDNGCKMYDEYLKRMSERNFNGAINLIEERIKGIIKDEGNALYNAKLVLAMIYPFFPDFSEGIYNKLYVDKELKYGYNPHNSVVKVNNIDKEIEI